MAWIGVALALIAPPSVSSIPQRLAAEQLEEKRATITYCGGLILDDRHLYSIDKFGHWKQHFISGVFIDIFFPVTAVKMHKNATDDDVKLLLGMPYLRELNLAYCYRISDEGVSYLRGLPAIQVLYLYRNDPRIRTNFMRNDVDIPTQPGITDLSLKYLAEIQGLRELYLWDNDFSDKALLRLKDLRQIRRLEYRTVNYSQETVDTLRRALPNAKINED